MLAVSRATLLAVPEAPVGFDQRASFSELVERRALGEPVAYIRGLKEFYGIALAVDRRALIPRPETELLVYLALERVAQRLTGSAHVGDDMPLTIWDVGTGSGAIIVALAVECRRRGYAPDVRLCATDAAPDALSLAVENAAVHGVADMIDFAAADLTNLPAATPADVLVANLPYIATDLLPELPVAAGFEPAAALDGGRDGLVVISRLLAELPDSVRPDGVALVEIGSDQRSAASAAVGDALPRWSATVHADLAGQPRVIEIVRPGADR